MIPNDLYDLPTMGETLVAAGSIPSEFGECLGCATEFRVDALFATSELPHSLPPFLCAVCISQPHREGLADQELAEALALGPDWTTTRVERDRLLAASDWTQMADAPITEEVRVTWATYRQQLRDVPQTFASPDLVVWPTPPNQTQG